jgi:diacylglycerol kinase family enzyme
MRFQAVLNRDGGTLRTTDLDAFSARMRDILEGAGHGLEIEVVSGKDVAGALEKASARRAVDVVLAGGGDGTISTAAARLKGKKKALAVLPAGTMNLFARSLGIPLELEEAVRAYADGKVKAVDIASANGQPFVHQFSIGMHAKMVQLREKMDFGSRLGKIRASARAAWMTLRNPPALDVKLTIGEAEMTVRTTGIGIANNLFGEGHMPYADNPAGGVLGVYVNVASQPGEMLRHAVNMMRGRWRDNEHVEIHQAERVKLSIRMGRRSPRAVMDGELIRLEPETVFEIHPKALSVLVPADAT